jgi:putative FmdB family regulatory protein
MPIYAYRCDACGHAKDVLQKVSDPVLTTCPACGAESFVKQVTAAGFQLKGSGWYVTDFRGGSGNGKAGQKPDAAAKDAKTGDAGSGSASGSGSTDSSSGSSSGSGSSGSGSSGDSSGGSSSSGGVSAAGPCGASCGCH